MISSLSTSIAANDVAAASVALYLLPTLIAWARRLPALTTVVPLNVLAGWTLIGWAIALAVALRPVHRPAGQAAWNSQPPAPAPHPHRAGWAGPPGPPPRRAAPAPPLILPSRPEDPAPASRADLP